MLLLVRSIDDGDAGHMHATAAAAQRPPVIGQQSSDPSHPLTSQQSDRVPQPTMVRSDSSGGGSFAQYEYADSSSEDGHHDHHHAASAHHAAAQQEEVDDHARSIEARCKCGDTSTSSSGNTGPASSSLDASVTAAAVAAATTGATSVSVSTMNPDQALFEACAGQSSHNSSTACSTNNRPRSLSYNSGLAELTKRLAGYYKSDDNDDDVYKSEFGDSGSNLSLHHVASKEQEEDRTRAQTAMERIRNKRRAGAGGGGSGSGRAGSADYYQRAVAARQDMGPSCIQTLGRRRKRSSSEPPPTSRTVIGDAKDSQPENNSSETAAKGAEGNISRRSSAQSTTSLDLDAVLKPSAAKAAVTSSADTSRPEAASRSTRTTRHKVSQSVSVQSKSSISDLISNSNNNNPDPIGEAAAVTAYMYSGTNGIIGGQQERLDLESRALTQNFVMEHRIFLRAILQLLNERDQFAVEADANDPHTIKTGPLKKATSLVRGVWMWKVKYVEVRRGLFSYYEDTTDTSTTAGLPPLTRRRGSATMIADNGSDAISPALPGDEGNDDLAGSATPAAAAAGGSAPSDARNLRHKSIPLRAATCTCRAVKVQNKALSHTPLSPNGAVFELTVENGPRRLWMCNTREERQAWIHAIHEAMIGGSVTRGDNFLEYQVERKRGGGGSNNAVSAVPTRSPYRRDLERYLRLQEELKSARRRDAYVGALSELYSDAESLNVPVQWIKERIEVASGSGPTQAFHEGGLSSGVAQLWKDMLRDSVSINGDVYKGDGGHGPERIIGALARCILSFDKSATQNVNATRAYRKKFCITEAQAVSYARDVLLACNRTRSGGDSYYCMDTLCSNHELVVLCPSSSEADPLRITVRHSAANDGSSRRGSDVHGTNDISGWILTRSGPNKSWKKRYGVLSEGVLSYYEQAHPRPHGLRGQLLLAGATIGVSQVGSASDDANRIDEMAPTNSKNSQQDAFARIPQRKTRYIVCIISKDRSKERQIIFDDQSDFFLWNQSFRDAIKISEVLARGNRSDNTGTPGVFSLAASVKIANKIRGLSARAREGVAISSPVRNVGRGRFARNNVDGGVATTTDAGGAAGENLDNDEAEDEGNMYESLTSNVGSSLPAQVNRARSANWKKIKGGRARSTVEVSVQNTAVYKICTVDPQGVDSEDTWAMLRTNFLQNFRLSGGPNGRILRGEEIVQLNFLEGLVANDTFDRVYSNDAEGTEAGKLLRRASMENLQG